MRAKENIRIWFEFYKLALNDPKLSKEIEKSKEYYSHWGDVKNSKFDKWWNDHKALFDEVTMVCPLKSDPP